MCGRDDRARSLLALISWRNVKIRFGQVRRRRPGLVVRRKKSHANKLTAAEHEKAHRSRLCSVFADRAIHLVTEAPAAQTNSRALSLSPSQWYNFFVVKRRKFWPGGPKSGAAASSKWRIGICFGPDDYSCACRSLRRPAHSSPPTAAIDGSVLVPNASRPAA